MGKSNSYNYFDMLVKASNYSYQCALMLSHTIENFNPDTIEQEMLELHEVEHTADFLKHEMVDNLLREFITPIDREDIMILSDEIDNVTDSIEDIMRYLYIYNINTLRPEALEFSKLIVSCCETLEQTLIEFKNFKKSKEITKMLVKINELEDKGDELFARAMHKLFVSSTNAIEVMSWSGIFEKFENCCDKCEDVSDVIQQVIMQNT